MLQESQAEGSQPGGGPGREQRVPKGQHGGALRPPLGREQRQAPRWASGVPALRQILLGLLISLENQL